MSPRRGPTEHTLAVVAAMRELVAAGHTTAEVAQRLNVSTGHIRRLRVEYGVRRTTTVLREKILAVWREEPWIADRAVAERLGCSVDAVLELRQRLGKPPAIRNQAARAFEPPLAPDTVAVHARQVRAYLAAGAAERANFADAVAVAARRLMGGRPTA